MNRIERIGYITVNETHRMNAFTSFLKKIQTNSDEELLTSAFYNPFSWIIKTSKHEYAGINIQKCEKGASPVSYFPFDVSYPDKVYMSPYISFGEYEKIKSKNDKIEYFIYFAALDEVVPADKFFEDAKAVDMYNVDA